MIVIGLGSRLVATIAFVAALLGVQAGCAGRSAPPPHLTAFSPDCAAPDERRAERPTPGCANRNNLAAMVAAPADLERGRALSPASGARESHAVETYLKGPAAKPATSPSTTTPAAATPPSPGAI